jgi:hypothetical protein
MDGKIGITNRKRYMKVQNNSILLLLCILLSGCAMNKDFELYVDAQKSISRDATMSEAARISVLIEMTKSSDNLVKLEAIRALQEIQRSKAPIVIQPPKKNWFGF